MADIAIIIAGDQNLGKTWLANKLADVLPEWMATAPTKPLTINVTTTNAAIPSLRVEHGDRQRIIVP